MTVDTPDYVGLNAVHHGKYTAFNAGTQVITPGSTYSSGDITLAKPGYWLFLNAQMAASAASPYILIEVFWKDATTGTIFDDQQWVAPAGTTAAIRTVGRGPVTGDKVLIQITNLDATQNVTLKMIVTETSHAIARHDWRSLMNANWTAIGVNLSAAPGAPFSGTLFQGNPSIPATTTKSFQMALYPGQVQFQESDAGASPLTFSILPVQNLQTATSAAAIYSWTGATAGVHGSFWLPRQCCLVAISNPNAAAVVCTLNLTLLEVVS